MPDPQNVAAIRKVVDDVVLVTEEQMVGAVRRLYLEEGVLAEPAGAATTAAWLQHPPVSGRAVLLVSGGNISDSFRKQAGI
jgi:threonine dehydratase